MKQSVNIPNAPVPIGPYSPAIIAGNQLFVSGQIPLDPIEGTYKNETIEEATHQVMKNVKNLVTAAGFTMNDVVKCTIFLTDLNNFSAVNQVYASYFNSCPPARETVEIRRLPMDAIVEISCIAIKA